MSSNFFDPSWTKKTTVPVRRIGDQWEFFYGGDVPVKEGTMGELTISTDQITDLTFLQRVTAELTVKILDEGVPLLVALSDRSRNGSQIGEWPKPYPLNVPPGTTRWEQVKLGPPKKEIGRAKAKSPPESGGLWLTVKGLERCEIRSSSILLPEDVPVPDDISDRPVNSLNHAFTLLSRTYEKHRISNTGNIYTHVFYQEKNGCWYPLDDLRMGVKAQRERQLLLDTWAEVEAKLGWRPIPIPKRIRR